MNKWIFGYGLYALRSKLRPRTLNNIEEQHMKKWSHELSQWVETNKEGKVIAKYCPSCTKKHTHERYCSELCKRKAKEFIDSIRIDLMNLIERDEVKNECRRTEREVERGTT